ncbi:MAG: endonuclease VIII [Bacilli bacterium]|jgi:formamidopyrimidine-DNA glycosylase|nr:endonuclease VIII [Bacilli bacterium]
MLELPECYHIAKQLNQVLIGKKIKKVIANDTPHKMAWYFEDNPSNYHLLLRNRVIRKISAFGPMIEIAAGRSRILLSDGVIINYYQPGEEVKPKHQLYIEMKDGCKLVCSIAMYGGLFVFLNKQNKNLYYLIAKAKPSPLSIGFNETYFTKLFDEAKPTLNLKAFLATEQRIPGLGNGVLQDILFASKLNPKRKLMTLDPEEKHELFHAIKDTLAMMAKMGGRDTEKDIYGKAGGYLTILSNGTKDHPCPRCRGTIVKEAFMGGSIYYCDSCQK